MTAVLFWMMIIGACAYAIILGGWEGRCTAAIFILASLASYGVNRWFHIHWHRTNISMFLVDFLTFVALYGVAAKSRHWWPVWVGAFQLNTVAAHLATITSPDFAMGVYKGYEGLWAIPCALVMVIGIFRDRMGKDRRELRLSQ
jgi:hypothetical protein